MTREDASSLLRELPGYGTASMGVPGQPGTYAPKTQTGGGSGNGKIPRDNKGLTGNYDSKQPRGNSNYRSPYDQKKPKGQYDS